MEEQLHAFLNSELGEGAGNRHAWAALQLQKYTSVPTGLEVGVSQRGPEFLEIEHFCPSRTSNKDALIEDGVA
jgi:hypothetical protein